MSPEQLKEHFLMHLKAGSSPEESVLNALRNYRGQDEFLLGAQAYLVDHGPEELNQIQGKLPDYKVTRIQKKWRVLAAAGFIAVFLLAWAMGRLSDDPYQRIEEGAAVFMGGDNLASNDFMNAYRTGDYKTAISFGKKLMSAQSSDTLFFYMGCALNYVAECQEALTYFAKLPPESKYSSPAFYQKAYAFYELDQKDSARYYLNSFLALEPELSPQVKDFLKAVN